MPESPHTHPSSGVCSRRRRLLTGLAITFGGHAFARVEDSARPIGPSPIVPPWPDAMPAPILAQNWRAGTDPAGWLVSEKLDGVRALWTGERMFFRSGRELALPAFLRERLPRHTLDGELWLGRGRFDEVSGLLRSSEPRPDAWLDLQYHVFELPGAEGRFGERASRLQKIVGSAGCPGLHAARQESLVDAAALRQRLDAVVALGGEGLMLHRADAPGVGGRTPWLCKFKPLDDAEAVVIGYRPGQGRHAGRLGALRVRGEDGREFAIGTGLKDRDRDSPPPVGARVTYSHQGLTDNGLPRFARFVRVAVEF